MVGKCLGLFPNRWRMLSNLFKIFMVAPCACRWPTRVPSCTSSFLGMKLLIREAWTVARKANEMVVELGMLSHRYTASQKRQGAALI